MTNRSGHTVAQIDHASVFDYYWSILGNMINPELQSCQIDSPIIETEVCQMLDVTPEQGRLMASPKPGYRSHLHEEDAFTCGEIVDSYWRTPDDDFRVNPGTCTREYGDTLTAIGGKPNA